MLSLKNIIKISGQVLLALFFANLVNLHADQQFAEGVALPPVELQTQPDDALLRQKGEQHDFALHDIQVGYGKFFAFSQGYIAHLREQDPARQNQLISIIQCADKMHHEIITAFRNGCFEKDYELIIKFENIFRGQQFDLSIQPRHLRKLRKRISKFNDFFQHYRFTKKHSLSLDELQVFEKIITLNSLMTDIILTENFFSFGVVDKSTDVLLFKPAEFVARHKLLFTILTLAAIAGGCYWIYRRNQSGAGEMYRISTDECDIEQLRVLQQSGNTCAVHALFNAHCMLKANGDKAAFEKLCADEAELQKFIAEAEKIEPHLRGVGLQDAQLEQLRHHFNIPADHLIIVPARDDFKQTPKTSERVLPENRTAYDALYASQRDLKARQLAGEANLEEQVALLDAQMTTLRTTEIVPNEFVRPIESSDPAFPIKIAGLRDGAPLVVVYNCGKHAGNSDDERLATEARSIAHWTALRLHNKDLPAKAPSTEGKKKFDVRFADSLNSYGSWIKPVVDQIISLTKLT